MVKGWINRPTWSESGNQVEVVHDGTLAKTEKPFRDRRVLRQGGRAIMKTFATERRFKGRTIQRGRCGG